MNPVKFITIVILGLTPLLGIAQVKSDTAKPVSGLHQVVAPSGIKDTTKPAVALAPPTPSVPFPDTNIHVYEQPVVKNTVQKIYDYQRYSHCASPGFRVQIDFGQERNTVNSVKSNFSGKYPSIPCYITYKQPYFRVSIGDCRKRLDAVRLLNEVKKDYPAAFIVADRIESPPLQ